MSNNSGSSNALTSVTSESDEEEYEIQHIACYVCNGYYGPCFDEPVCATCHSFLFPDEWTCANESGDEGDSGNDEPEVENNFSSVSSNNGRSIRSSEDVDLRERAWGPGDHQALAVPQVAMIEEEIDNIPVCTIGELPPEVLLVVFSYLDDLSLWSVGNVCRRWKSLIRSHLSNDIWKSYTHKRFPIYKDLCYVRKWCDVYGKLMNSCPCKACLVQMSKQIVPSGEENVWRRIRLGSELRGLMADPPEGIVAVPLDEQCFRLQASITGPVGSPYEGGIFYLYIQVPYSYPMKPPVVKFLTKIFHPNVSRHGDVGMDVIRNIWWSLRSTISKTIISVQSLLTDPFCNVCMEPNVARLYIDNRVAFDNIARAWTWKYAMHDIVP